ncbi:NAD(P)-dependent oxidoreductase, partial [Aquibium sp. A9E412]|uniref:NAD(P)-dependent oxidoreductase n=1 Tax=Aquibium sp. A9E412 TaxID=2976767 RepID=UPI0025B1A0E6
MTATAPGGACSVAFIGLGMMGRPMAERLRAAGFDLRGVDTDLQSRQALAASGVRVFENARAAVAGCDIVVTMLPDGTVVREVVLGEGGVAACLKPGALVVDMSSSAPMSTRKLGALLLDRGLALVDAPVSGGVARARDGSLCIMAGGRDVDVARARPLLDAMGTTVIHAGPLGCGHAAKALNNYVSAAGLAAACEAMLIGEAFGVDPATLVDILNASTGRNNATEVKLKPHILSGSFASGFAMTLMAKDLHTASDLAKELGMTACGAECAAALWSAALADLGQGA